jgi:hypothetical protein
MVLLEGLDKLKTFNDLIYATSTLPRAPSFIVDTMYKSFGEFQLNMRISRELQTMEWTQVASFQSTALT